LGGLDQTMKKKKLQEYLGKIKWCECETLILKLQAYGSRKQAKPIVSDKLSDKDLAGIDSFIPKFEKMTRLCLYFGYA